MTIKPHKHLVEHPGTREECPIPGCHPEDVSPNHPWDDKGPISQGKILTVILKGDPDTARDMLSTWTLRDLETLYEACEDLQALISRVTAVKRGHRGR